MVVVVTMAFEEFLITLPQAGKPRVEGRLQLKPNITNRET
jgi:hypothetical protein